MHWFVHKDEDGRVTIGSPRGIRLGFSPHFFEAVVSIYSASSQSSSSSSLKTEVNGR